MFHMIERFQSVAYISHAKGPCLETHTATANGANACFEFVLIGNENDGWTLFQCFTALVAYSQAGILMIIKIDINDHGEGP